MTVSALPSPAFSEPVTAARIGIGGPVGSGKTALIERLAGYLSRFVRDGHPRALKVDEHQLLAKFFGVDERDLGVRTLWLPT